MITPRSRTITYRIWKICWPSWTIREKYNRTLVICKHNAARLKMWIFVKINAINGDIMKLSKPMRFAQTLLLFRFVCVFHKCWLHLPGFLANNRKKQYPTTAQNKPIILIWMFNGHLSYIVLPQQFLQNGIRRTLTFLNTCLTSVKIYMQVSKCFNFESYLFFELSIENYFQIEDIHNYYSNFEKCFHKNLWSSLFPTSILINRRFY